MKTTFILVFLILSLSCRGLAVSQDLPDDVPVDQYLLEATQAIENGDTQRALKLLSTVRSKLKESERRHAEGPQRGQTNVNALRPKLFADLKKQMVSVRGGIFRMGCTTDQRQCYPDEKPVHQVRVSDFEISRYEVTQTLWDAVMGENPSGFKGCAQCPVERVSWEDVQTFLKKLNALTGERYRLPTEAEWEYAARGGRKSQGYQYAGSEKLNAVAWYFDNSGDKTHPVGQKQPNELGLYDMSGNVWEWVEDCWNKGYTGAPSDGRAWQSGDCSLRGLRGGSWFIGPEHLQSAHRDVGDVGNRVNYVGFRLALTP